jgi:hypothetical protein
MKLLVFNDLRKNSAVKDSSFTSFEVGFKG